MSNFVGKVGAEWLVISGDFSSKRAKMRPALFGFAHYARYTAVSFLQRHPVYAANDTLIAGIMDKIKTIRTFRSGS